MLPVNGVGGGVYKKAMGFDKLGVAVETFRDKLPSWMPLKYALPGGRNQENLRMGVVQTIAEEGGRREDVGRDAGAAVR